MIELSEIQQSKKWKRAEIVKQWGMFANFFNSTFFYVSLNLSWHTFNVSASESERLLHRLRVERVAKKWTSQMHIKWTLFFCCCCHSDSWGCCYAVGVLLNLYSANEKLSKFFLYFLFPSFFFQCVSHSRPSTIVAAAAAALLCQQTEHV